ncbi:extracellular solute-binding protein [Thauera humireducens]|uniref:extracellular solute-binding protein n=1 Tax=Thauera humireducens TaxID=1134435 RepID=UPI00311F1E4A
MKKAALAALLSALDATTLSVHAADTELNTFTPPAITSDEASCTATSPSRPASRSTGSKPRKTNCSERIRNEGANSPADLFRHGGCVASGPCRRDGHLRAGEVRGAGAAHPRQPAHRALVLVLQARPDHRLQPRTGAGRTGADLRATGGSGPEGQGVHSVRAATPTTLSLGAAMIKHNGADNTVKWASGLVENFARAPKGGDTDQIKAVAAGECGVAIANSYYPPDEFDQGRRPGQVVAKIKAVWPNQQTWGTHINVSGAGMLKHAPNKGAAVQFLEYLASDEAQALFCEWQQRVAGGRLGEGGQSRTRQARRVPADAMPIGEIGKTVGQAQRIYDRAGYR